MRWISTFLHLVPIVEKFVHDKSLYYHIDGSHNLHHSLQVKELGLFIAGRDYRLKEWQKEIVYLSCMLHDMCDLKYTTRPQSIMDISNFLIPITERNIHDGVMDIITTMSYSQTVKPDGCVEYPRWLRYKQDLVDVFHITRESDLLTSYDLKRMIHYKHEHLGMLYSCDIYDDIVDTVDKRMSKLLQRNLFVSPTAIKIAQLWQDELCEQLIPILTNDDIYPIFNQPFEPLDMFKDRVNNIFIPSQSLVKNDFHDDNASRQ